MSETLVTCDFNDSVCVFLCVDRALLNSCVEYIVQALDCSEGTTSSTTEMRLHHFDCE